jgi:hypothetical protein
MSEIDQPKQQPMVYLRPTTLKGWPAEICVRGDENLYVVVAVSKEALMNIITNASNLLREFESNQSREEKIAEVINMKEVEDE